MITDVASLKESALRDSAPPEGLSPELKSLWLAKAGRWEESHDIAQDIDTAMGSWIHALLHLIEGDTGNAGYWFHRAGKPTVPMSGIDRLWDEIAGVVLG